MNYPSIQIYGNILSSDLLNRLDSDESIPGQKPKDFGFEDNVRVRDEISQAWSFANNYYQSYKQRLTKLKSGQSGESETRNFWITPLLGLLGYNLRYEKSAQVLADKTYHITDPVENMDRFPVIISGHEQDMDKKPYGLRMSPHALLQEYLNYSEPHLYGFVTNGRVIRLLRDSGRIIRLSYLEVDLEQMFDEGLYADFAVFFRLLHASRLPQKQNTGPECLMEQYHLDALESGTRIRERLSEAVEDAIQIFGTGFLNNLANSRLRDAYEQGKLTPETYYRLLLRLIYRLLFLMVIEERNLVYPGSKEKDTRRLREIYYKFYSVGRLRLLTRNLSSKDKRYNDHWQGLKYTFLLFENKKYGEPLGIKPLNGELFSYNALEWLEKAEIDNKAFLSGLEKLSWFTGETGTIQPINYKLLNVEEFGSVYEGLLEYDPNISKTGSEYVFDFVKGTGRSSSGSHYTEEELVQPLIKHSLDYLLEDREKLIKKEIEKKKLRGNGFSEEREKVIAKHLLDLKVADIACGSGHILLSAARRIANRYASLLEEADQPTPTAERHAKRLVIRNCIYGVDKNPLAVELCKVALWLEAHNPGEPLNFLDHHIKCGDSIVGLAHRDELEEGIPDEAFKSLPGDEKEVAAAFRKQNKEQRKTKQAELFDEAIQEEVNRVIEKFHLFENLPERTPEEIAKKTEAHEKFNQSVQRIRLKQLADAKVAQFFIPKTISKKEYLITENEYRNYLRVLDKGLGPIQSRKLAYASDVIAREKYFFHFFLEFPEVFEKGGFDCILGNPPFLGGQKLTGIFGNNFTEFIRYEYSPIGSVDLVTYFFRRIFTIIKNGGFLSLISTNTIAQGDARIGGLAQIIKHDGVINHAVRSMKWPGMAAVEVSLVTIHKGSWNGKYILNHKKVSQITSYLDDSVPLGEPFPLKANKNKSFQGSIVLGKGFILTPEEAQQLIRKNPRNQDVLFPYLNGDDLNTQVDQSPTRWVINFKHWPLRRYNEAEWNELDGDFKVTIKEKLKNGTVIEIAPPDYNSEVAADYPDCLQVIERLVKPERIEKKGDRGAQFWWQFLRVREDLYHTINGMEQVLVINRYSKNLGAYFCKEDTVFSDSLFVFAIDEFKTFAIFSSFAHDIWAWKNSSTMGTGTIRYSGTDAFETFVFFDSDKLSKIGKQFYEYRKEVMERVQIGLTKTYNYFHDPSITNNRKEECVKVKKNLHALINHLNRISNGWSIDESINGIINLRELQIELDKNVLEVFDWNYYSEKWGTPIDLAHDFYELDFLPEDDNIRFTISPEARKEILKRLLLLNHEHYKEEIKQGLHKEKDVRKFYEQKDEPVPEGIEFADKKNKYKKSRVKRKNVSESQGGYGGLFD